MKVHPLLDVDSYKPSQWLQYPPGATSMFSYLESRGGKYSRTVMFGLQYYLEEYLSMPVTMEIVEQAKTFFAAHGEPFNYEGWKYIATELKGKLPIRIKAVPEGIVVPTSNMLMSVESTDPKCFWVVSWVETMLMRVWYPITVATQSFHIKKVIQQYLDLTADDPSKEIAFKLHDFGSRGVSSQESAGIGGMSHLVNFEGSDTVVGVLFANHYYKHSMAGFSIPASEHSSMTMWGRENEVEAYRNMIKQYGKPGGIFACVSDSYNLYNAVENIWGKELKGEVINSGATLVVRPDSGDPATVVLKTVQLLDKQFGSTYNSKTFKVLNSVRVIQGDGIDEEAIRSILELLRINGYSATNVAFGMGGALLQQVNRDTQKFAFKCSEATVDGVSVEVYKDPVTDQGKRSKRGRLDLTYSAIDGKFNTVQGTNCFGSIMKTVFENGEIVKRYTLDEIRERVSRF